MTQTLERALARALGGPATPARPHSTPDEELRAFLMNNLFYDLGRALVLLLSAGLRELMLVVRHPVLYKSVG